MLNVSLTPSQISKLSAVQLASFSNSQLAKMVIELAKDLVKTSSPDKEEKPSRKLWKKPKLIRRYIEKKETRRSFRVGSSCEDFQDTRGSQKNCKQYVAK